MKAKKSESTDSGPGIIVEASENNEGDNEGIWYDPENHPDINSKVKRKFVKIIFICAVFITAEIVGGILADSIAI
jgi:Co/Zn/Cd efflux system component